MSSWPDERCECLEVPEELHPNIALQSIFFDLRRRSVEHHCVASSWDTRCAQADAEDRNRREQSEDPVAEAHDVNLVDGRLLLHDRLKEPERRTVGDQREQLDQNGDAPEG